MRASPSCTLVGSPSCYGYGVTNPTFSSAASITGTPDTLMVDINVTSGGANASVAGIGFSSSAYIVSSAEL
jgi:hypothetical protein